MRQNELPRDVYSISGGPGVQNGCRTLAQPGVCMTRTGPYFSPRRELGPQPRPPRTVGGTASASEPPRRRQGSGGRGGRRPGSARLPPPRRPGRARVTVRGRRGRAAPGCGQCPAEIWESRILQNSPRADHYSQRQKRTTSWYPQQMCPIVLWY